LNLKFCSNILEEVGGANVVFSFEEPMHRVYGFVVAFPAAALGNCIDPNLSHSNIKRSILPGVCQQTTLKLASVILVWR
jgi:hypothetical protein